MKKKSLEINIREYRKGIKKWTIQRNCQHRVYKTKTNNAKTQHNMCWAPLSTNKHKKNVNKTYALLQTTEGKDELNIVFLQKS